MTVTVLYNKKGVCNMEDVRLIEQLSNANGISGFEDDVLKCVEDKYKEVFNIERDRLKNMYLFRKNHSGNKPVVLLDAHSDEVGFMVQSIKANGLIRFLPIGGWHSQNVPAHKVRIVNNEGKIVKGIVASTPPHFLKAEDRVRLLPMDEMYIDVGATSKDEVVKYLGIEPGAPVIPDVTFEYDENRGIMIGKGFDNRLGCACVIRTLNAIEGLDLPFDVVGGLAAQEEVGTRGSTITARKINPDLAIVFEGTPSDDFKPSEDAQGVLKKGPQIRYRDSSYVANPAWNKFAANWATKEGIPHQKAVRMGGGTNAGKIHLTGEGVPCLVLGVPVRYAHTHYGISSILDFKLTVRLSSLILKKLTEEDMKSFY